MGWIARIPIGDGWGMAMDGDVDGDVDDDVDGTWSTEVGNRSH
jgi:hypothetical protein